MSPGSSFAVSLSLSLSLSSHPPTWVNRPLLPPSHQQGSGDRCSRSYIQRSRGQQIPAVTLSSAGVRRPLQPPIEMEAKRVPKVKEHYRNQVPKLRQKKLHTNDPRSWHSHCIKKTSKKQTPQHPLSLTFSILFPRGCF